MSKSIASKDALTDYYSLKGNSLNQIERCETEWSRQKKCWQNRPSCFIWSQFYRHHGERVSLQGVTFDHYPNPLQELLRMNCWKDKGAYKGHANVRYMRLEEIKQQIKILRSGCAVVVVYGCLCGYPFFVSECNPYFISLFYRVFDFIGGE